MKFDQISENELYDLRSKNGSIGVIAKGLH